MEKIFKLIVMTALVVIPAGCNPIGEFHGSENPPLPPDHGYLEVRFLLPEYAEIPKNKIHRISLGLSFNMESMYRGEFFKKINVSDYQEKYTIILPKGEYFYEAGISCSCGGDSCLWGGFPGGYLGMKYDFDGFVIRNEQTSVVTTHFMY